MTYEVKKLLAEVALALHAPNLSKFIEERDTPKFKMRFCCDCGKLVRYDEYFCGHPQQLGLFDAN